LLICADAASVKDVVEPTVTVESALNPAITETAATHAGKPAADQPVDAPATSVAVEAVPANVADEPTVTTVSTEDTTAILATTTTEEVVVAAQLTADTSSAVSSEAACEEATPAAIQVETASTEAVSSLYQLADTEIASAPTSGAKRSRAEHEKEEAGPELRRSASKKAKN
jgi:hypothetical protein